MTIPYTKFMHSLLVQIADIVYESGENSINLKINLGLRNSYREAFDSLTLFGLIEEKENWHSVGITKYAYEVLCNNADLPESIENNNLVITKSSKKIKKKVFEDNLPAKFKTDSVKYSKYLINKNGDLKIK